MIISVSRSSVRGILSSPSSKSVMQRLVACALLADGESEILAPSLSDDSKAAIEMARCLGAGIRHMSDRIIVKGGYNPVCTELFCGESGLGARVFSVLAALNDGWIQINGEGSLTGRPVDMIEETLSQLDVDVRTSNGLLPVRIKGPMKGGDAFVDGSLSSQFLTGLLISLPVVKSSSRLIVNDLRSKPYIDLTIEIISSFGIEVQHEDYRVFNIPGSQIYRPVKYTVEGDWSGSAFILVLAALAGEVTVKGLSVRSTQSDRVIIEALRAAGVKVIISDDHVRVYKSKLRPFVFNVSDCPDLAPPLAVLASFCEGKSVIRGTERLKAKESDRGKVLETEFSKLGVNITNYDDRIEVKGPSIIKGGEVDSNGDHRIAMALTVLSLLSDNNIIITGAESVNKSYPSFFNDLKNLGCKLKTLE